MNSQMQLRRLREKHAEHLIVVELQGQINSKAQELVKRGSHVAEGVLVGYDSEIIGRREYPVTLKATNYIRFGRNAAFALTEQDEDGPVGRKVVGLWLKDPNDESETTGSLFAVFNGSVQMPGMTELTAEDLNVFTDILYCLERNQDQL